MREEQDRIHVTDETDRKGTIHWELSSPEETIMRAGDTIPETLGQSLTCTKGHLQAALKLLSEQYPECPDKVTSLLEKALKTVNRTIRESGALETVLKTRGDQFLPVDTRYNNNEKNGGIIALDLVSTLKGKGTNNSNSV
ncbi:MAG: hypothetical protein UU73_C0002G0022 [Candidatus Daviesbacteria bacterium GW2011_GWA1_41_61]|uniref:Uncharacterized protein n=1 Tax=Candidatus Daviesbacteria bacterium GW2011_GWA2_40_9 TaxID=1618424 RepID=A0A0G0U3P8_9BACT|nr:MAG: hypothetical protein UU26_C0008G0011 [Candidatus Daviesbacteria bacterium GW2011_GWC1_40_9]KKR83723.1 MAG: hypothetical protein UU29_C0002G0036 [Candidatus Daviesbacteria bacterium GW2011_GWA2_40_9]KKR93682.1 MAG: hypothetical protein UU44_C0001G0022 [Candidatus Daviesbacteria bacterium GW2011_GWB1_41_15]KKS15148.1 MAG: hypothetical protein UU73_C0002G0022 [Candidatus Daviesbacteria bacterium GW2011_GWA1_41_61]